MKQIQNKTMQKSILFLLSITILFFSSCKKEDSDDTDILEGNNDTPVCDTEELHECTPYTVTNNSGVIMGSWSEANDIDSLLGAITTPDEPGGGIMTVSLTTPAPASPNIEVRAFPDPGSASIRTVGNNVEGSTITVSFTAHPNQPYSIFPKPFFNANSYPHDYTINWSYEGRMDCYEPNDIFQEAKHIPKDLEIEAYCIAGHINNNVGSLDQNTYDWYKFTLDKPSKVEIKMIQSPSDVIMTTKVFNSNEESIYGEVTSFLTGSSTEKGSTFIFSPGPDIVLDAGTYYLQVHRLFATSDYVKENSEEEPDHFVTPYKFSVHAIN